MFKIIVVKTPFFSKRCQLSSFVQNRIPVVSDVVCIDGKNFTILEVERQQLLGYHCYVVFI